MRKIVTALLFDNMDMVDNIEFIQAVKERPGIWNYKSDQYQSKGARHIFWEEICEKFFDDFAQKSAGQKFEAVLKLQKKWKALRDSYTRYRHKTKIAKRTGEIPTPRPYTYAPYLTFLSSLTGDKSSSNSELEPEQIMPPKRKIARTKFKKHIKCKIETPPSTEPKHDEDKLFLMSLLKDFKKISEDVKLDAKVEIMEIIKKYKQSSTPNVIYLESCKQNQSDYECEDGDI